MSGRSEPVSVVLPTYGRPEHLPDTVRSVTGQTHDDVELLVVDDCSPQPVEPMLRELDTEGVDVRCFRHDENRGASAARNTGIEHASGDYVAFVDDDDRWIETKLERQLGIFRESPPEVGVVYTGQRYVDRNGRTTNLRTPTTEGRVTEDVLRGASLNPFSCAMVESSVIERAGLLDERLPSWQDREWYLRLSRHCAFAAVPEPLVIRRVGHDQISDDYEAKRDVSYPLFLEKHRSLAASLDCEDAFVAYLSRSLAGSALSSGRYREALRHLATALAHDPTYRDAWLTAAAAIGGPLTYRPVRRLKRMNARLRG